LRQGWSVDNLSGLGCVDGFVQAERKWIPKSVFA
jgi:hypothetical protein